ncbi:hypothetical protein BDF21DRAFT_351304 [Thamnidium elegans]|nr:hypothetical protein BDF21DRAFT_351304 [Thamnidium elegans]
MIRVKIFASQLINEIGRQFFNSVRSPFFGSRRTRISFQDFGDTSSSNAWLYTSLIRGCRALIWNNIWIYWYPKPSSPGLLCEGLRFA